MTDTVRDYCLRILRAGDLAAKLAPPRAADGGRLDDSAPGPAIHVEAPARNERLRLHKGAGRLPPLNALGDPAARISTLARFAHHELMAVELFAWALLQWPELPASLRRGFLQALAEEQIHLGLYLDRLAAHGAALGDVPLSDYFWQHVPAIAAGGPQAFLAAMGLTLEQANLDFTLLYRDAFRTAGDEATAQVLQRVHDDEIGHVRLAAVWLRRLAGTGDEVEAYAAAVPFPFSAARAKARRFDVKARRRAGLSDAFIDWVRAAKPYGKQG
ncbi:DUF455 family protein [Vulgatibacter sp.]|uniref:DUF455 family protein n=1 Tax=Vulgatibacter sp. TaxID=1971226 RepID=UPI0035681079